MSHQYEQEVKILKQSALVLLIAVLIVILVNHWDEIKLIAQSGTG